MNEKQLLAKADAALSDLISDGGYMQPDQSTRFMRKMMDQPTLLQDVRVVPMRRPKMEINKIGFGSRMLRAANQGTISSPRSGEEGTRALARADRYKPTFSKITLDTDEVIAEINLPYELLEDNIEGGSVDGTQFQNTILEMMADAAARDLEELIVNGDTGSGDSYLALQTGALAGATSNIVNHNNATISPQLFANMIKALPVKYHRLLGRMRFYCSTTKEIDYRMQVAQRQTQLGDALLTGTAPVSVLGVRLNGANMMPNANMLLTIPSNLILGVHRQMRLEFDRDVRERVLIIVLTMRVGMLYEEEEMVVKAINVG
jgi:HK97 family phage major capsid protein